MPGWPNLFDPWRKSKKDPSNEEESSTTELICGECPPSNLDKKQISEILEKAANGCTTVMGKSLSPSEAQEKASTNSVVADTANNRPEQTAQLAILENECETNPDEKCDGSALPIDNLQRPVVEKSLTNESLNLDKSPEQTTSSSKEVKSTMPSWLNLFDPWWYFKMGSSSNQEKSPEPELIWGECPPSKLDSKQISEIFEKAFNGCTTVMGKSLPPSEAQEKASIRDSNSVAADTANNYPGQAAQMAVLDKEWESTPKEECEDSVPPIDNLRISVLKRTLANGCLNLDKSLKHAVSSKEDKCAFTESVLCSSVMTQTDESKGEIFRTDAATDTINVPMLEENNNDGASEMERESITSTRDESIDGNITPIQSSKKTPRNPRKRQYQTATATRRSNRLKRNSQ